MYAACWLLLTVVSVQPGTLEGHVMDDCSNASQRASMAASLHERVQDGLLRLVG